MFIIIMINKASVSSLAILIIYLLLNNDIENVYKILKIKILFLLFLESKKVKNLGIFYNKICKKLQKNGLIMGTFQSKRSKLTGNGQKIVVYGNVSLMQTSFTTAVKGLNISKDKSFSFYHGFLLSNYLV